VCIFNDFFALFLFFLVLFYIEIVQWFHFINDLEIQGFLCLIRRIDHQIIVFWALMLFWVFNFTKIV